MKPNKTRTNTTTYSAKVPENEVTAALCAILAKDQGFSLDAEGISYRGFHSSEDSSTGIKHSWKIEVTVDHSQDASASASCIDENLPVQE